jgi:hypothetical protein
LKHLAAASVILGLLSGGWLCRAESIEQRKEPAGNVADLARQYRELRAKRRQLPAGARLKELDDFGGKLHRTLSALGDELGHPPHTRKTVVEYLGEPDAVLGQRDMNKFLGVYYRGSRESARKADERRNREYLIYFWRGWHDFLFFITEKGAIVDHGWWFAYE